MVNNINNTVFVFVIRGCTLGYLLYVMEIMSSPGGSTAAAAGSTSTTRRRSGRTHNVEDETLSQIAKEVKLHCYYYSL